jgi:hypothetical protein
VWEIHASGEISLQLITRNEGVSPLSNSGSHMKKIQSASGASASMLGAKVIGVINQVVKLKTTGSETVPLCSAQSVPGSGGIAGVKLPQIVADFQLQEGIPYKLCHIGPNPLCHGNCEFIIRMKPGNQY